MATEEDLLNQINKLIEDSAEKFNSKLPASEEKFFSELQQLLKGLDLKGDKIVQSVKNLKLVGIISKKLLKIIVDKDYKANVKEYLQAFNDITSLQNEYYTLLEDKFKPNALLQAIRLESINSTLDGLTNAGLTPVIGSIKQVLQQNVTTGGSYKDLMRTMSSGVSSSVGGTIDPQYGYSKIIKTLTITSVAQYSRNYAHTVAEGLNFKWYQYVGSTITTTRCFCHAMVKKRYFHRSEIPDIIAGNFKEFEDRDCEINPKTDLPDGMIKGTNASNFMTYAGGWNCQHSIFPVPESRIPQDLINRFKDAA
jgi:hypothetical protein